MNYPKSLTLVCKVTGVTVKYTNAAIIKKKCDEAGSVESFVSNFVSQRAISAAKRSGAGATITAEDAQYQSKGAGKVSTDMKKKPETKAEAAASFNTKAKVVKPILEQGVALGKLSKGEYTTRYVTRMYPNKDGSICTVTAPATTGDQVGGRIW